MNLEQYKSYWVRPDTLDRFIVDELKGYEILPLKPNDVVLDVGGCIGSYARWAAGQVSRVVTFEPMPDNFTVLKKNVEGLSNVEAHQLAVTADGIEVIDFYVNKGQNKGAHSMVPFRGRDVIQVRTQDWATLVRKLRPSKIKMDCEGAEYSLLAGQIRTYVRGIVIEYHLTKKGQREAAVALHESLLAQKFKAIRTPTLNTGAWTAFAAYQR